MIAEVRLWNRRIAAVSSDDDQPATFQYDPEFAESGIQISPLTMPLRRAPYEFPTLPYSTFFGLPGLLADSLPDRFGNALIDAWLAQEGKTAAGFTPIHRLCYTGKRGMGALEYLPAQGPKFGTSTKLEVGSLVKLASDVLAARKNLKGRTNRDSLHESLTDILRVGTSAGGARAKAVVAWNPVTDELRSGQVAAGEGFEYCILKFDGVTDNGDRDIVDPTGFGAFEYAYSLMASAAGITMAQCRLLEENGRRHFMTRRFDRLDGGEKLHMQSLCALAHYDFNNPGAYSYEQALIAINRLQLPKSAQEEQFRRMVFNVLARNQDDHVKNVAFLMDKNGSWSLSPAFDITFSYNPNGAWTSAHQMTINGKRDGFTVDDLLECARVSNISRRNALRILDQVTDAVRNWSTYAQEAGIPSEIIAGIGATHRLSI